MKTKQQYFYNALILTLVSLLMRTVAVSFNVYVSGKVGAEAMGLLALISGVYNFAVTLATSGIHLATVRTVAERLQKTGGAENGRCLRACLTYALFFGTLATLLLFGLSAPVGKYVLKDPRTIRALRMMSITLLPIAVGAVLNGYFTAVRRAYKNAAAQISEQAIKIGLTGYLLTVAAPRTVEGSVLAILMGGAVAELFSLLLNILFYLFDKRHFKHLAPRRNGAPLRVAAVALPVAVSTYVRSGLLTVEHILIPIGLKSFGQGSGAALASYGSLQSMALPVILYPAAILASFASLLIPEITEQNAMGNKKEIRYIAGRVYQLTLLFSIGVSAIMLFLSGELGMTLYESSEVSYFIKRLAPLIPIMYLDTATDAMLKGLGEQVYSMNVNIADAVISVLAVWILVPIMGINGYLVTIYITEIFNAAFSVCRLLRISGFRPKAFSLLARPLLCSVGATCISRLGLARLSDRIHSAGAGLTLHILFTALLYVSLLFLSGTCGKGDLRWASTFFHSKEIKRRKEKSEIF